ncbi:MAG TPA: hypothetical protein VF032_07530 [Thermoleophilaceae bacterium]
MLVLASTVVTVVIIVAVVLIVGVLISLFGPLGREEKVRDDVASDAGPFAASAIDSRADEEIAEVEDRPRGVGDAEERLDRENE